MADLNGTLLDMSEIPVASGLRPRLCYLTKGPRGYGFHLHGERNRGAQFIRKIEPGSPADLAGLRSGDRVVEVNGENVEHAPHYQVGAVVLYAHSARNLSDRILVFSLGALRLFADGAVLMFNYLFALNSRWGFPSDVERCSCLCRTV
uniref:PDZ domain-containing protein n=1 Tax=Electrophorus electricus TaxID=8005 RepID=A0AAY5F317_ELEEL